MDPLLSIHHFVTIDYPNSSLTIQEKQQMFENVISSLTSSFLYSTSSKDGSFHAFSDFFFRTDETKILHSFHEAFSNEKNDSSFIFIFFLEA